MAGVAFPGPGQRGQRRSNVYLSGRGQFGRFLIREYASRRITLKIADAQEIITDLFSTLNEAGLLTVAEPPPRETAPCFPPPARAGHLAAPGGGSRRAEPGAPSPDEHRGA